MLKPDLLATDARHHTSELITVWQPRSRQTLAGKTQAHPPSVYMLPPIFTRRNNHGIAQLAEIAGTSSPESNTTSCLDGSAVTTMHNGTASSAKVQGRLSRQKSASAPEPSS